MTDRKANIIRPNVNTTCSVKKIDEIKLNKLIDDIPNVTLENIIRRKLPAPNRKRLNITALHANNIDKLLPNRLKSIVFELNLLDETSIEQRIKLFIGYCMYRKYSYNTTVNYYSTLRKNGLFGTSDGKNDDNSPYNQLKPSKIAFACNGKTHVRIVSIANFKRFVEYLHENISHYSAPILVAIYTGLRTAEILQFSAYTLVQLQEQHNVIAIKRKQTVINNFSDNDKKESVYWEPIYTTYLKQLVGILVNLYETEYNTFKNDKINLNLFMITPKTLANRIKSLYYQATNELVPHGFGIHSCRNMIAMLMAQDSSNVSAIQQFLQHKNMDTTRHYIKADFTHITQEFNRIVNYKLNSVLENVRPPN